MMVMVKLQGILRQLACITEAGHPKSTQVHLLVHDGDGRQNCLIGKHQCSHFRLSFSVIDISDPHMLHRKKVRNGEFLRSTRV